MSNRIFNQVVVVTDGSPLAPLFISALIAQGAQISEVSTSQLKQNAYSLLNRSSLVINLASNSVSNIIAQAARTSILVDYLVTPYSDLSESIVLAALRRVDSELILKHVKTENAEDLFSLYGVASGIITELTSDIESVISNIISYLNNLSEAKPPLSKSAQGTEDSYSFKDHDLSIQTGIPIGAHPGAFGVSRTKHTHEGIDLYAEDGDPVFSMTSGRVVGVAPFTGSQAESPWWLDTFYVMIESSNNLGSFCYGEITPVAGLQVGDHVSAGDFIGSISRVLAKDKGRPTAMLHLERYVTGVSTPISGWPLFKPQPLNLLNPTSIVCHSFKL